MRGRSDMSNDDDDSLDDVNSLMKMIGGAKKKGLPQKEAGPAQNILETPPPPPGIPDPGSGGGDFSVLMKKLGMANKPESAPAPVSPPTPVQAPPPPHAAEPAQEITGFEDLLEEVPAPEPEAVQKPGTGGKDVRETLGKLLATMGRAQKVPPAEQPEAPGPAGQEPRNQASPPKEPIIEIIDEDPKAALRKVKPARKVQLASE